MIFGQNLNFFWYEYIYKNCDNRFVIFLNLNKNNEIIGTFYTIFKNLYNSNKFCPHKTSKKKINLEEKISYFEIA